MNLETTTEYFYGDALRWSYGFENPNKAAVLFVCALPVLFSLFLASWRAKGWLRFFCVPVSTVAVLAAWYGMGLTFSRGGLVAACGGIFYVMLSWLWGKYKRRESRSLELWSSAFLVILLAGMTFWNGLGKRSVEGFQGDASVGNRVELWSSALQMVAENPRGFGKGTSGEQYMQWYQPLERKQGYRTMVNSYLTFLVERGWFVFAGAVLVFAVFWAWTKTDFTPDFGAEFSVGLRGGILGFLIAGVFSTTMEEMKLWIFPVASCVLLVVFSLWRRKSIQKRDFVFAGGAVIAVCGFLFITGFIKSSKDPVKREFGKPGKQGDIRSVIAIGPAHAEKSLGVVMDESVLGARYARLLRELATGANVRIFTGEHATNADAILCAGGSIHSARKYAGRALWLLAPEKMDETELVEFLANAGQIRLLLPEIDEDGRVEFWEEIAEKDAQKRFQVESVSGAGRRVDCAWDEIVEFIQKSQKAQKTK